MHGFIREDFGINVIWDFKIQITIMYALQSIPTNNIEKVSVWTSLRNTTK